MPSRFSENLSRLRRDKGVSQRLVASELHVSQALLSHYENGVREPGLDFVCRVCGYYGVSADYLLGLTDRREPDCPQPPACQEEPGCRMVTDVCALLWKALDRAGDPVLLEQGMDFVADAVYKVFRHLYHRAGTDEAALFQVPASEFSFLSDADMKVCEMNF